jgi:hypothetical protein
VSAAGTTARGTAAQGRRGSVLRLLGRFRPAAIRLARGARRHWLFALLFAAGTALRAITFLAYRPALLFSDSIDYLHNRAALIPWVVRPLGYPLFLRSLPLGLGLDIVPLVHHVLGLSMAVAIYVALLRLGVVRWLAAAATAPVLLDAMQLNLEQYILSDTLMQALLLAACLLLVWKPRPGLAETALAGAALAGAALTRPVALLVIIPVLLTLVLIRAPLSRFAAVIGAFALPIVAYAIWFNSLYGVYSINGVRGQFLYARVAPFADCSKLSLPTYEKELCPTEPVDQRPSIETFAWSASRSPLYRLRVPSRTLEGRTLPVARSEVAGDFAWQVIRHQPVTYARTVGTDFLRGFAPIRTTQEGGASFARWQFHSYYPHDAIQLRLLSDWGERPGLNRRLASFLSRYQRFAYTPGPLLGAALLTGLIAMLGVGSARTSGLRSACFLFSTTTLVVLGTAVAVSQFSWRYQLPQLVLLPPAGALALAALSGRCRESRVSIAAVPRSASPSEPIP